MTSFFGKTAVAGIGATEFSKESGRTELQLALEACKAALDDAGIHPSEVDGFTSYYQDTSPSIDVARGLGCENIRHFSMIDFGGGAAAATIAHAAMAVATGAAEVVLAYRAFNERSGARFGAALNVDSWGVDARAANYAWYLPHGLMTPASWIAMFASRYMKNYGATSADFGRVAVLDRHHAATNPKAWFYEKPITLQDHQESRWIAKPLHLLDCCQESDGGQAFVVTTAERARDLKQKTTIIAGASQGATYDQHSMTSFYRKNSDRPLPEAGLAAQQLWDGTGLKPSDMDVAILYDHFTPFVLAQLEEYGFCKPGEAKDFLSGDMGKTGSDLPMNTHGGQLGEAYIHGMNGIAEGVRQIRGTAVNQVEAVDHVLVTAGTGVPTSALILSQDH